MKNKKKGFSLIEMMAVIAIVAVLVSIIVPTVSKATLKSRAATNAANLRQVEGTLATLRVSDYEAFMTAAGAIEGALGGGAELGSFIINSIIPGLADALTGALSTIEATNGILSLDLSGTPTQVTAPGAVECNAEGNSEMAVSKDSPMQVYITENQIICMYNGYTKEDFADVAEDGVYDGDGKLSWEQEIGNALCQYGHVFPWGNKSEKCACGATTNPNYVAPGTCEVCGGTVYTGGNRCLSHIRSKKCSEHGWYTGFSCPDCEESCITPDTLITLADGSMKMVKDLTYTDQVIAWNHFTGEYMVTSASYIVRHEDEEKDIITLTFSDGNFVKIVTEHGFFDIDENKYVFINVNNVADFVGHGFVKQAGKGYEIVSLESYTIETKITGAYSLASIACNNVMANGMFSLTPIEGMDSENFFNFLAMGDSLKYEETSLNEDIRTYGMFTYDDFAEYMTEEEYEGFKYSNGEYLKIAMEKGYVTFDQILAMLNPTDLVSE